MYQAVDRHHDQLLDLEICAEERNGRGGVCSEKQVDDRHHKGAQRVHDKGRQTQSKHTPHSGPLPTKAIYADANLLICAQQHGKGQQHGERVAAHSGHGSAADAHGREGANAKNQQRIKDKIKYNTRDLEPHGADHIASGLDHLLDGDVHHVGDLHKGAYTHIGNAERVSRGVAGKRLEIGRQNQKCCQVDGCADSERKQKS